MTGNGQPSADRDRDRFKQRAAAVRLAVFDIDGVMTDGRLYRDDDGRESKAFHSRDGLGVQGLMEFGVQVACLTARRSRLVEVRMDELGIELLLQGRQDKGRAFDELLERTGLDSAQTCYAGDDLVDWPAMRRAGLRFAPADADAWIRARVDRVTEAAGGHGAVREICEWLLAARGVLDQWRDGFR